VEAEAGDSDFKKSTHSFSPVQRPSTSAGVGP
jgi:hypothetical protein